MRNVTNKLKRPQRKEAHQRMIRIYPVPTPAQTLAAFHQWYRRWHPMDPEAADCLKRDLEPLLTIFRLPLASPHHPNALERVFVEVRRRTRPMLAFTDERSCERTCLSVFNYLQAPWNRRPIPAIIQKT